MGYRIREIDAESNFCQELQIDMIERVLPATDIAEALAAEGIETQRVRKLDLLLTVLVIVSMNIYPYLSIGHVIQKLARGLRFIWPDADYDVPKGSALSYRRYQLGAPVMAHLFRHICRPIATPETKGAFCFGLRTMAIDGTTESLPDTAANAAVFGRHHTDRSEAAFPQTQCVYLAECGTHVIVDAGFWPIHTSERVGGHRMLRSVTAGMLVMWDRGFHDYSMIAGVQARQAHVLSRLPAHAKPERVQTLPDGSWLAYIYPSAYQRRKQGERCLVRIIEYKVTDPALADPDETHRLLTTLLDPDLYPAVDLICAYHERWEIEIAIDEIDTHQRLSAKTLRSLKPVGVIQELYGLLIAHFIIRFLMHEAAVQANIDPDQLSFVHAVEVIKDAIPEFQMVAADQREQLYQRLLRDIARRPLPERRNRVNPRVVKQKMSNFLKKRPKHYQWPQPEISFREAVVLI
ncbi:MAG: IS4 family transposase [Anaerolineae bacterium]|jgi:hypothetical protein